MIKACQQIIQNVFPSVHFCHEEFVDHPLKERPDTYLLYGNSEHRWAQLHRPVPHKMLPQDFLLSQNLQDTSQKWCMWHGILAGNLNLVSIILLRLATSCA